MTDRPSEERKQSLNDSEVDARTTSGHDDERHSFLGFNNLRSLLALIVVVIAFRSVVMSPYHVPTGSMEPTIKIGDRLLALKMFYDLRLPFTDIVLTSWRTPQRGDIIVFQYPKDPSVNYVKRVVALAGDLVEIKQDILHINGQPQTLQPLQNKSEALADVDHGDNMQLFLENLEGLSHMVTHDLPASRRFQLSDFPAGKKPFVVPEKSVFVLGDNRDHSLDSRTWGEVPLSYVKGKAMFIIWSIYSPTESGMPSLRFNRFGKWLY